MSRKSFGQLLQKYLRGECTPEEKAFVEHWYGLLDTNTAELGEDIDWSELEDKLWNQMQRKLDNQKANEETPVIPLHTTRYRWISIAAAVLILVGWFAIRQSTSSDFLTQNTGTNPVGVNWIEQTNTSLKPMVVRLEDGSTVQLAAQSTLRFPKKFASENRTVYLTGDAFFDIQKMPSRPFFVHAGGIITKVLGTSFFVRTREAAKQIHVEVIAGRVAVYQETTQKQKEANGVVLTPNQATTFFRDEQHFVTGLVDKPVMIKQSEVEAKSMSFQFDDAPLSVVIEQLEEAYGIAIEVENEQQNNCPLTADLTNQTLYTQLDIICAALKSNYKIQGTTILISGKGCD